MGACPTPSTTPTGNNAGTISITIPRIASWITVPPSPTSKGVSNNSSIKAYAIADSAHFELKDSANADVVAPWDVTNASGNITTVKENITPGTDYTLYVKIYNLAVSSTVQVVEGQAGPISIVDSQITPVTVTCIPYNPTQVVVGTPSAAASLSQEQEKWYYADIPDIGLYDFTVSPTPSNSLNLGLFNAAGVNISSSSYSKIVLYNSAVNTRYYLGVANTYSSGTVNFTVNVSPTTITSLPLGPSWTAGSLNSYYDQKWYSFDALAGNAYTIGWDDSYQGSGTYTSDVYVSAYHADFTTSYFSGYDSGYSSPQQISVTASEKVYIKVYNYYSYGTFALQAINIGLAGPTNVAATDGTVTGAVTITWDSVPGAVSYNVYRSASYNGPYSITGSSSTNSYNDTTAPWQSTFYYKVTCIDTSSNESALSLYNSGYARIPPPTGVSATDGTYTNAVSIKWDSMSNVNSYRIYRGTSSSGSWSYVGDSSETDYINYPSDTATYYFVVKAYDGIHGIYSTESASDAGSRGAGGGGTGGLDITVQ
jgi:hypothetical protein